MLFNAQPVYIFLFYWLSAFVLTAKTSVQPNEKSGPYVITVTRCEPCEKALTPYAKNPVGFISYEMKDSVLRGNITIFRKNRDFQVTAQDFYYENGNWQMTFNMKKVGCRNKLISAVMDLMGIKYDKITCTIAKGVYPYEVDLNKVNHLWTSTREYGRLRTHLELQSKDGTIACWELECDVTPIK